MASVYKRGRWVDSSGQKCPKNALGAKYVQSRLYTIQIVVDGRQKLFKGYTDRGASMQLAAKLERRKAQGEEGLIDPYEIHRKRPLAEHVADWIAELQQLGRSSIYVGLCGWRMARVIAECEWKTLGGIDAATFIRWRQTATSTIGRGKPGANTLPMGACTKNHYTEALRAFCLWAIRRKRMASNPIADVEGVETVGQLRRQRRALTEDEVNALLGVVPGRHQLAYRMILSTGLRRDELKQLRCNCLPSRDGFMRCR